MAMLRDLAARGWKITQVTDDSHSWCALAHGIHGCGDIGGGCHTPEAAIERAVELAREMEGQGE
jgi:hypothetical protein